MKHLYLILTFFLTTGSLTIQKANCQNFGFYTLSYDFDERGTLIIQEDKHIKIPDVNKIHKVRHLEENTYIVLAAENGKPELQLYSIDIDKRKLKSITSIKGGVKSFNISDSGEIICILKNSPENCHLIKNDELQLIFSSPEPIKAVSKIQSDYFYINHNSEIISYSENSSDNEILGNKAGSEFIPMSKGAYSYIYQFNNQYWYLKKYILEDRESRIIIKMPQNVKIYNQLNENTFITADGNKLLAYTMDRDVKWREKADLTPEGFEKIDWLCSNGKNSILIQVKK